MVPDARMLKTDKPLSPGFQRVSHFCYLVRIIPFDVHKVGFNTASMASLAASLFVSAYYAPATFGG